MLTKTHFLTKNLEEIYYHVMNVITMVIDNLGSIRRMVPSAGSFVLLVVVVVSIIMIYFLICFLKEEKKSPVIGIPVIPGGTKWGGHLHLLREPDFQMALKKWTIQHADHMGRCTFWMGPTTPSLCVRHPSDVQMVLKATAQRQLVGAMSNHFIQLFGNQNVGMLNGTAWKQQRSRITKALHSTRVITNHEESFRQTTQQLVNEIMDSMILNNDSEEGGGGVWYCNDILLLMKSLSMDCFGRAAFHSNFGSCHHYLLEQQQQQQQQQRKEMESSSEEKEEEEDTTATAEMIGPALDRLTKEMMRRVTKDIMNPLSHNYWLPTTANKQYANDKQQVLSFLQQLIKERRRCQRQQKQAHEGESSKPPPADLLTGFLEHFDNNNSNDNDKDTNDNDHGDDSKKKGGEEDDDHDDDDDDLITMMIAQSIMGLVFAGYETSSVTISYTIYLLSQHPTVLENCLEDIRQHHQHCNNENNNENNNNNNNNNKDNKDKASTKTSSSLIYLDAVVRETLRLYPPAISTTRINSDRQLELLHPPPPTPPSSASSNGKGGNKEVNKNNNDVVVIVPKGTYLYIPIWTIQRDPNNYDDPLEFRPERWVELVQDDTVVSAAGADDKDDTTARRPQRERQKWKARTNITDNARNAWIPFSAGARACPGQHFAMQEILTVLSVLLPQLTFEPPKDYIVRPHRDGFVQMPKGGIPMKISSKKKTK